MPELFGRWSRCEDEFNVASSTNALTGRGVRQGQCGVDVVKREAMEAKTKSVNDRIRGREPPERSRL